MVAERGYGFVSPPALRGWGSGLWRGRPLLKGPQFLCSTARTSEVRGRCDVICPRHQLARPMSGAGRPHWGSRRRGHRGCRGHRGYKARNLCSAHREAPTRLPPWTAGAHGASPGTGPPPPPRPAQARKRSSPGAGLRHGTSDATSRDLGKGTGNSGFV